MRTKIILTALLTMGFLAITHGQEEKTNEMQTLFGNRDRKIDHGGYAGLTVGYTQIDGENVMTLGGRAGWLIDHHVTIGLAGNAFLSSIFIEGDFPNAPEDGLYLTGGYGGLFVEPILAPNFPIHVSFPIMIGAGGLALNDYTWHDYEWDYDYYEPYDWDYYFVFEPGIEIELNVVKYFRVAFGGSYRLTSNLHINEVQDDLLNGFNANVTFKFGKF